VRGEEFGVRADRREGRPQLVGGIGREPTLGRERAGEALLRGGQSVEHAVERGRQHGHLVARPDGRQPPIEVARPGDVVGRGGGRAQRPQGAAHDHPGDQDDGDDREDRGQDQEDAEPDDLLGAKRDRLAGDGDADLSAGLQPNGVDREVLVEEPDLRVGGTRLQRLDDHGGRDARRLAAELAGRIADLAGLGCHDDERLQAGREVGHEERGPGSKARRICLDRRRSVGREAAEGLRLIACDAAGGQARQERAEENHAGRGNAGRVQDEAPPNGHGPTRRPGA
jgi:hypothetical protein